MDGCSVLFNYFTLDHILEFALSLIKDFEQYRDF